MLVSKKILHIAIVLAATTALANVPAFAEEVVPQAKPAAAPAPAAEVAKPAAPASLTFTDALKLAYSNNPDLQASRAELRSVDELYAQAKSGYRPVISGQAAYTSANQEGNTIRMNSDEKTLAVVANQPLYRGGITTARVEEASSIIKAQRAILHVKEQDVLLQAISSYMDVLRDQEIVRLNHNNENVFKNHLKEAQQRFELGDITKTDVSQSESRLAAATAGLVQAESNYQLSRAIFQNVIGLAPDGVQKPNLSIDVPSSLQGALDLALKNNPNIAYSSEAAAAAKSSTRAITGELLPQIGLSASVGEIIDPASNFAAVDSHMTTTSIGVQATVPLYSSGSVDARVRQAKQVESQRRMERMRADRDVQQIVVDAWTGLQAAEAEMSARKAQISAANLALEGVKVETEYGSRTTLDMLDAEQEALNAQVAYVSAERQKIVAAYRLLSSVGELTANHLALDAEIYNPDEHFQRVKDKWIGTSIDKTDVQKPALR